VSRTPSSVQVDAHRVEHGGGGLEGHGVDHRVVAAPPRDERRFPGGPDRLAGEECGRSRGSC
jgi:hypothetical protein